MNKLKAQHVRHLRPAQEALSLVAQRPVSFSSSLVSGVLEISHKTEKLKRT